jgi:hypothetical protein
MMLARTRIASIGLLGLVAAVLSAATSSFANAPLPNCSQVKGATYHDVRAPNGAILLKQWNQWTVRAPQTVCGFAKRHVAAITRGGSAPTGWTCTRTHRAAALDAGSFTWSGPAGGSCQKRSAPARVFVFLPIAGG